MRHPAPMPAGYALVRFARDSLSLRAGRGVGVGGLSAGLRLRSSDSLRGPLTLVAPLLDLPTPRGEVNFSPLDLGKISHGAGGGADFVEEFEAVFAERLVLDIDRYLVEEGVDDRP